MDELAVSTVVYVPAEEVYDFLVDFPRYAEYSEHLSRVVRSGGDGGPGTRYGLRWKWWKLTYTMRSQVTEVEPPSRIDWRITKDLNASGRWLVEELDTLPDDAPDDATVASRVSLEVEFDPNSANKGALNLPRFVNFGWVLNRVKPLVLPEAERVVERIVADLEGESRPVELTIHEKPSV